MCVWFCMGMHTFAISSELRPARAVRAGGRGQDKAELARHAPGRYAGQHPFTI